PFGQPRQEWVTHRVLHGNSASTQEEQRAALFCLRRGRIGCLRLCRMIAVPPIGLTEGNRMNRLALALLMMLAAGVGYAGDREGAPVPPKPKANDPEEPLAKQLSFEKAAQFLDGVSAAWTRERKCGTCHTNYPYLLVRPVLKDAP